MYGFGRLFKRGRIWWIAYSVKGKEIRESSHSEKKSDALALLKLRGEEKARFENVFLGATIGLSALLDDYVSDARLRDLRSIAHIVMRARHLKRHFGDCRADEITTRAIRQYQEARISEGAAPATVNRETVMLGAALRLAASAGLLKACPVFPRRLRESEPRQGFFEHWEYVAIREQLPEWAQDVFDFCYCSGWRRNEVLHLTWAEVSLEERMIRLQPDRSKNGDGRPRPLGQLLQPIVVRRIKARRISCPFVFHREGRRISPATWHKYWALARERAGLKNKYLHDARRTMARNLVRADVKEDLAMAFTGHKTRAVFQRYNIVDERDLLKAEDKLKAYLDRQEAERTVIPLFRGNDLTGA